MHPARGKGFSHSPSKLFAWSAVLCLVVPLLHHDGGGSHPTALVSAQYGKGLTTQMLATATKVLPNYQSNYLRVLPLQADNITVSASLKKEIKSSVLDYVTASIPPEYVFPGAVNFSNPSASVATARGELIIYDTTTGYGGTRRSAFTYRADYDAVSFIGAGDNLTEHFDVFMSSGTEYWRPYIVLVEVTGVNDPATFTGLPATATIMYDTSLVDPVLSTTGSFNITDPDEGEAVLKSTTPTPATGTTPSGTLNITSTGPGSYSWQYSVNTSIAAALCAGQFIQDTFTVMSGDGTANGTISITVTGQPSSPPVIIACPSNTAIGTAGSAALVTFNLAAADPDLNRTACRGIESLAWSASAGSLVTFGNGNTAATFTASLPIGSSPIRFTVTDQAGLSASCTTNVTVTKTCPSPTQVSQNGTACVLVPDCFNSPFNQATNGSYVINSGQSVPLKFSIRGSTTCIRDLAMYLQLQRITSGKCSMVSAPLTGVTVGSEVLLSQLAGSMKCVSGKYDLVFKTDKALPTGCYVVRLLSNRFDSLVPSACQGVLDVVK